MIRSPRSIATKYGFLWVTLILFLGSLIGHWAFAWTAYVQEQHEHAQEVDIGGYFVETARDTLENWQSEFLQLIWQVAGLALLFYIGSPQSKEGDERKEEKLDALLKLINSEQGTHIINELDRKFPGR